MVDQNLYRYAPDLVEAELGARLRLALSRLVGGLGMGVLMALSSLMGGGSPAAGAPALLLVVGVVGAAAWLALLAFLRHRGLRREGRAKYRLTGSGLQRLDSEHGLLDIPYVALTPRGSGELRFRVESASGAIEWELLEEPARFIVAVASAVEPPSPEGALVLGSASWAGLAGFFRSQPGAADATGAVAILSLAVAVSSPEHAAAPAIGLFVFGLALGVGLFHHVARSCTHSFTREGIDFSLSSMFLSVTKHVPWSLLESLPDRDLPRWPAAFAPPLIMDPHRYWRFWLGFHGQWLAHRTRRGATGP
jgi:hypothetical protein